MKKITTLARTALLGALALLAVTCGKKGSGDYRNLIPEDAFITLSVNSMSLIEKAGFSDAERAAMKGQAQMAMMFLGGTLSEEDKDFLLSILDSPENSGIGLKKDMYLSLSMDGDAYDPDDVRFSFIMNISDAKKFRRTIEIVKKLDPSLDFRTDRGKDVLVLTTNPHSTIMMTYDDNAAVVFINQKDYPAAIDHVAKIFEGKSKYASDKRFTKFIDGGNDFGALLNYAPVIELLSDQLPAGLPYLDILSSAHISIGTNFEKGKIETEMDIIFTDEKKRKEYEELYSQREIEGKFSKYLSENAIFAMSTYLEGGKTYESLLQLPQTAIIGFIPEAKEFLESLEGELFISVSDFGRHGISGAILATVTDPDILDTLIEKMEDFAEIEEVGGNYYAVDFDGDQIEFGIKGDILFIATDSEIIAALEGNSVDGPERDVVSMFEKGNGAAYVNFENLVEVILDNLWYSDYVDPGTAGLLSILEMFQDVRAHIGKNPSEAKIVINMADQDKNAMATIADRIREAAIDAMF
ncbi:MAG: DUF4836 family protein [Rikenellaceae bacterium]|nr:DUF4836 family protein [Rikenellaceae bacterium]